MIKKLCAICLVAFERNSYTSLLENRGCDDLSEIKVELKKLRYQVDVIDVMKLLLLGEEDKFELLVKFQLFLVP